MAAEMAALLCRLESLRRGVLRDGGWLGSCVSGAQKPVPGWQLALRFLEARHRTAIGRFLAGNRGEPVEQRDATLRHKLRIRKQVMVGAAREALFISHASPEDSPFTLWLGAKLTALGY